MEQKKVLIACPTSSVKAYCMEEWLDNVNNFTYENKSVFMCDNSNDYSFYSDWKNRLSMEHINPNKFNSFYACLAASHERCRLRALGGGFDYLLHLESDVFPPINTIERLLDADKGIVGALYHIELGEDSNLMIQCIEQLPVMKTDRESWGEMLKMSVNFKENDLNFVDGKVKQVFSVGLGCVLIHKSVLPLFNFRYEEGAPVAPDSFFAADMDKIGMPIHVDTSIICEHKNHSMQRI
jgi:hypothetical protein